jgi:hypothetical protein
VIEPYLSRIYCQEIVCLALTVFRVKGRAAS